MTTGPRGAAIGVAVAIVTFVGLSLAEGITPTSEDPNDVSNSIMRIAIALVISFATTALLTRMRRTATIGFITTLGICIATGLALSAANGTTATTVLLALPDTLIRGAWSIATWTMLGLGIALTTRNPTTPHNEAPTG